MIVKCPICSRPYETFNLYAGDQSMCYGCREAAKKAVVRPDNEQEKDRRKNFFGLCVIK